MDQRTYCVLIDNCAVEKFAEFSADPVTDLKNTEFRLGFTPDLRTEYQNALDHGSTSHEAKALIKRILLEGTLYGIFGWGGAEYAGWDEGGWAEEDQRKTLASKEIKQNKKGLPRIRTDLHLVALAKHDIVITANTKEGHFRQAPKGKGQVIQWDDFEKVLAQESNVASALRRLLTL
jgi:hypothetical protein